MSAPDGQRARRPSGFSLIEILAVVAIFGLIAFFVLPNLGVLGSRELHEAAERLRDQLEFARQSAIVTARPTRVVLDLDAGTHRVEAFGTPASGGEEPEESAAAEAGPAGGRARVSLAPPPRPEGDFEEVSGIFGRDTELPSQVAFASVETDEGVADRGTTQVAFDEEGTTFFTQIVLDDAEGRSLVLEVLPLADAVRILDAPR